MGDSHLERSHRISLDESTDFPPLALAAAASARVLHRPLQEARRSIEAFSYPLLCFSLALAAGFAAPSLLLNPCEMVVRATPAGLASTTRRASSAQMPAARTRLRGAVLQAERDDSADEASSEGQLRKNEPIRLDAQYAASPRPRRHASSAIACRTGDRVGWVARRGAGTSTDDSSGARPRAAQPGAPDRTRTTAVPRRNGRPPIRPILRPVRGPELESRPAPIRRPRQRR